MLGSSSHQPYHYYPTSTPSQNSRTPEKPKEESQKEKKKASKPNLMML